MVLDDIYGNYMTKTYFTLLAIAGLLMTVDNSRAGLGWSFDECVQHYGETIRPNSKTDSGNIMCVFSAKGYEILAFFHSATVSRIAYKRSTVFDTGGVEDFLKANGAGAVWTGPAKDDSDNSIRWNGTKDGAEAYLACLTTNGHVLIIWTKEDDDYAEAHAAEEASGL
jgi:hypothetical protein